MKRIILAIFLFSCISARSQTLSDTISKVNFSLEDGIGEKLARLAVNNAQMRALDKQIEASQFEINKTKGSWLNQLTPSFNLNEGNLNPNAVNSAGIRYFYPRYNINLSLPLGIFITKPAEVKIAKAQYDIQVAEKETAVSQLVNQVEEQYKVYQVCVLQLALHESVLQDEYVMFSQIQERFKNNTASLEEYGTASRQYSSDLSKKLDLIRNVSVAKNELEKLIGMDLEKALTYIKTHG